MATCIGAGQLSLLGIRRQDLLVPEMNLSAVNSTVINIVGITFLKLKGGKGASERTTRLMVYIVEEMDHLLLSMEACKDLGIIEEDFPKVGSHGGRNQQVFKGPTRVFGEWGWIYSQGVNHCQAHQEQGDAGGRQPALG